MLPLTKYIRVFAPSIEVPKERRSYRLFIISSKKISLKVSDVKSDLVLSSSANLHTSRTLHNPENLESMFIA